MKPVIFVMKNENDKIELNREDFSKLIEESYEQGFADGVRACRANIISEIPSTTCSNLR